MRFSNLVEARRKLTATSLVTCMENSQLSARSFDVVFDPDDRSLHYTLDMSTQIDGYIFAYVDVYAYGFKVITKSFDVCSMNWKQFCPVHPGNIQIDSIQYISQEYVNMIPGITYQVPDIDAFVKLYIYNDQNDILACIQVFFSNGKTVSQTGVKWVFAVIAGIGLLLSATLSTFGNSVAASHISANTMSLFLYFQSVAVVAMQHVHSVPPIAAAWSENMAWSMGLIRVSFMQKIFRWYVQSTGGTPTLYLTATTMSVLTQRAIDYVRNLEYVKRAENILYGNQNTLIFRGIKRMGYRMNIENTSIVCTGFTFFVLCGYVLAAFIIVCKYSLELSIRNGWIKADRFQAFRINWKVLLKGAMLRYIYIGFTQLTILSFWEFTERDSGAVIVIACLFLILSIGLMVWASYRTTYFARKSVQKYNNPAALLYGDDYVLDKYGFFYSMFSANFYWWNNILLGYVFIKSLFIGFAQASGKTQALSIFILDLFYFVAIIRYKPYLDRPTNIMNIVICVVTVINSFLFMFFSDLFNQKYAVSAIMGWVFFIMNAAFSFILLMMILAFAYMIAFTKSPDTRFRRANDDRAAFQKKNAAYHGDVLERSGSKMKNSATADLWALGNMAGDHEANWEANANVKKNRLSNIFLGPDEDYDDEEEFANQTFTQRVIRKLSMKRGKSKRSNRPEIERRYSDGTSTNGSSANKSEPKVLEGELSKDEEDINFVNHLVTPRSSYSSGGSPVRRSYIGLEGNSSHDIQARENLMSARDESQRFSDLTDITGPRMDPFRDNNSNTVRYSNGALGPPRDISLDSIPYANQEATNSTDILDQSGKYL